MAPHSNTLAWKIPWTEEPGKLQSMGSWRVRHDWVTSLWFFTFTFHFHALEKEMATHSSTLAWKIPWMEEPGKLQSMGSQRIGHDWATSLECFHNFVDKTTELCTLCELYGVRIVYQVVQINLYFSPSRKSAYVEGYKLNLLWDCAHILAYDTNFDVKISRYDTWDIWQLRKYLCYLKRIKVD